jgi:hypothetical protein
MTSLILLSGYEPKTENYQTLDVKGQLKQHSLFVKIWHEQILPSSPKGSLNNSDGQI